VDGLSRLAERGDSEEVHDRLFLGKVIAGHPDPELEERRGMIFKVWVIDEAHELGNGTGRHGKEVCKI
jgi:hypothetical protein